MCNIDFRGGVMSKCEAHNIIENELNRIKDNESELYSLDRQRQKEIAEMKADVREIKTEQLNMKKDINVLKNGVSETNTRLNKVEKKVDTLQTELESIKDVTTSTNNKLEALTKQHKWQPKDYTVVIVAAFSMIGVIISAILSYLK